MTRLFEVFSRIFQKKPFNPVSPKRKVLTVVVPAASTVKIEPVDEPMLMSIFGAPLIGFIEKRLVGVEVPIPTFPLAANVVVPITEVEEAKSPDWNQIGVEVELTATPKFVVAVNGNPAPVPVPQAVPLLVR